ncbi:MAG: AMP-binding protein [Elusimicrobiota bacterium]|nr:AMP-binding protein [Elusimicrobiota bacterium]
MKSSQIELLRENIRQAYLNFPFYRKIFKQYHIDVNNDPLINLRRLPILSSRDYYKLGTECLSIFGGKIFLIDSSAGSTGRMKKRVITIKDEITETEQAKRVLTYCNLTSNDSLLIADIWFPNMYPLFVKASRILGLRNVYGLGIRSGNQEMIKEILQFNSSVLITIPSVFRRVFDIGPRTQERPKKTKLKKIIFFGETTPQNFLDAIKMKLHVEVFNYYGTTEIGSLGVECYRHDGMHVFEDMFYIDLVSKRVVEKNIVEGELLVTTLAMEGQPLFKYRVGDVVRLNQNPCGCKDQNVRLKIIGRTDDMVTILGTKCFLAQFDEAIFSAMKSAEPYELMIFDRGNRQILRFGLDKKFRRYEGAIVENITKLANLDLYLKSNYIKIEFRYDDFGNLPKRKLRKFIDERQLANNV